MTNEQLAIFISRYSDLLGAAMTKIPSCGESERGYKELDNLLERMKEDYDLLSGRVHHSRARELERIAGSRKLAR